MKITLSKTLTEKELIEKSIKRVLTKNPQFKESDITDIVVDSTPTIFYDITVNFWPNRREQI